MLSKEKYYGEIWFPDDETVKCFCVMTYTDRKISLETNLTSNAVKYKHKLIYGIFTGLGYLTFLDIQIKLESSGMINSSIYQPRYAIIFPNHFVNPINLRFKNFIVSNRRLIEWKRPKFNINSKDNTIITNSKENYPFRIEDIKLSLEVQFSTSTRIDGEEFILRNQAYLNFKSDLSIKLIDAIDTYNKAQKLIQFISGKTEQFSFFSFQCLDCDDWGSIYFQDISYKDSRFSYFTADFNEILPALPKLINSIYTNSSFHFCVDKLLNNQVTGRLSHSQRFTNSISCLEAYSKLFNENKNTKLKNFLNNKKELIKRTGKIPEEKINDFIAKIIRTRDYHVHSNIKNNNIFSDFELLYISFLLDIIVAIRLLNQANTPQSIIDKIIRQGQSVFTEMQGVNKILSHDYLNT